MSMPRDGGLCTSGTPSADRFGHRPEQFLARKSLRAGGGIRRTGTTCRSLGMRRAASMSRVLTEIIRRRHGAYLERRYREHEQTPQRRGEPAGGAVCPRGSRSRRGGLAGRGQRARPDPGAAGPAGTGERGDPRPRDPLHRVRAPGRVPLRRELQAGLYAKVRESKKTG